MNQLVHDSLQKSINEEYDFLASKERILPIKISNFYKRKIIEEYNNLKSYSGPLHKIIYPSKEKIHLRVLNEVIDFVNDRKNMPPNLNGKVIHKYKNRILFMPTNTCLCHCQYCFRQDVLSEFKIKQESDIINDLVKYINNNTEVKELIISGGDPLTINPKKLTSMLYTIKHNTNIDNIRIHTRALAFNPAAFTSEKIELFSELDIRIVNHISHPYEICSTVKEKIKELRLNNIKLYNQFPLLRGVNDHINVLTELLMILDKQGIRNLSIFIPDPINYSATFRISYNRINDIIKKLNWSTPSWINSTRVVLDSSIGKLRLEDVMEFNEDEGIILFKRENKIIKYHDFPEHLDIPGNIDTLLWKKKHA